jgi:hypothetical protein
MMMDCMHAMAPNDVDLLNFALDDEPLPEKVREHLEQCNICQRRLATYKHIHNALLSSLYRRQCPTGTQLSFYCADMLQENERLSIAAHLLDCPLCMNEVSELRQLLKDVEPFPPLPLTPTSAVRRIIATFLRQQPQLALRSEDAAESAWPRQYHAASLDLSLHLSRASDGEHILLCIITNTNPAESIAAFDGSPAELYTAPYDGSVHAESLLSTQVDDLGNIVFKPVPSGECVMVVRFPAYEIVVDGLMIKRE